MKWILMMGLLGVGAARAESSRGYLAELKFHTYYVGLTDANEDVQLPLNWFSQAHLRTMSKCMDRREEKAILVELREAEQHGVPTGIPGQTTTTHLPKIVKVSCVSAPGFIHHWRRTVNGG